LVFSRCHKCREYDSGIDSRVEERIQVIIRKRDAMSIMPEALTAIIAAKNEQIRHTFNPGPRQGPYSQQGFQIS
jgi:hypothetical protein